MSGEGTPLVMVHGAGSARWSFDLVRPHLESRFTVIAIDRRGRGDSSDGQGYSVEREFEDVAAVVRDAGEDALLFGHSYGGLVAAGAAQVLDGLPRLVLYEPPMGGVLAGAELIDRWERLILEGARPDGPRVPPRGRRLRRGRDRRAGARPCGRRAGRSSPTVPRELRAELALRIDEWPLGELDLPTLLLVGSESPAWAGRSMEAYAKAIPHAEIRILEGHGHDATDRGRSCWPRSWPLLRHRSDVSGEP